MKSVYICAGIGIVNKLRLKTQPISQKLLLNIYSSNFFLSPTEEWYLIMLQSWNVFKEYNEFLRELARPQ